MQNNIFSFTPFNKEKIISFTNSRNGEIKVGEVINDFSTTSNSKYIILGISEDIGPQANLGFNGANNGFLTFIKRFLNIQSNRFFSGENCAIIGEISANQDFNQIKDARRKIEELDKLVYDTVLPYMKEGKIIIIIGGGHNNAYPLIKASAHTHNNTINVINLDPHADCRSLEGRHSGNPFSYAKEDGFLNHYTVLGLHEQYNSEAIYNYLDKNNFNFTFFENYLDHSNFLIEDVKKFCSTNTENFGIELDLDSIKNMPSSAFTPSGFSLEEARQYIRELAKQKNITYLHLPEGAPTNDSEEKIVGKALSYLVSDFIKINSK